MFSMNRMNSVIFMVRTHFPNSNNPCELFGIQNTRLKRYMYSRANMENNTYH